MDFREFVMKCQKEIKIGNFNTLERFAIDGDNENEMILALRTFYDTFPVNEKNFGRYKSIIENLIYFGSNTKFYIMERERRR